MYFSDFIQRDWMEIDTFTSNERALFVKNIVH